MKTGQSTAPELAEPSVWSTMRIEACNGDTLFTRNDAAAAVFSKAFPDIGNVTRAQAETILGWLHKASGGEVHAVLLSGATVLNLQRGQSAHAGS